MKVPVQVIYNNNVKHRKTKEFFRATRVELYDTKIRLLGYMGANTLLDIELSDLESYCIEGIETIANKGGEW